MSENIQHTEELDLDEWLATGQRTTRLVNIFSRTDLFAEIDALEAQKVPSVLVPEAERALGGEADPNAEINAQIEALEAQIWASKKVFRASNITNEEIEKIRETVLVECSDEISKAAEFGKSEAIKSAKRMGVTKPDEINLMVRTGVKEFTDRFVKREVNFRILAQSVTTMNKSGDWVTLTVDQVKALHSKLGEQPIDLLADAVTKANSETPEVSVPKS